MIDALNVLRDRLREIRDYPLHDPEADGCAVDRALAAYFGVVAPDVVSTMAAIEMWRA